VGDNRRAFAGINQSNIVKRFAKIAGCLCKCAIVIFLYIFINKSIVAGATWEFSAKELYSGLVEQEAPRMVENLDRTGHLTYGPYITLTKGTYDITVFYRTDAENNYVDVMSAPLDMLYYEDYLEAGLEQKKIRLTFEEAVPDLQIRTYYAGEGLLSVEKIAIEKDVVLSLVIANLLISAFVLFYELNVKKASYEMKFVCAVLLLLLMPMVLGTIEDSMDKKLDRELAGNFDTYTKPEFELTDFVSREYQSGYENWWSENFVPRGYIISAYNQIRYSLFGLGNRIIGKENSIFEEGYLVDIFALSPDADYSYEINRNKMREYVMQLESIAKNLELLGKEFYVYTTLSKAAEQSEQLPEKYVWKYGGRENVRAIDYFRSIIGEYEVPYLDTKILEEQLAPDYPVFYKTGIHWSRPFEQEVSVKILSDLRNAGVDVGSFTLETLQESDTPYWRDADVYEMLNVYQGTMDPMYYEYETSVQETGTARLLIQGDSFGIGLKKDFIENQAGSAVINFFYDQYIENMDGSKIPISGWENVDMAFYLEQADAIVVEVNEFALYTYSNGFVAYLSEFLKGYAEDIRKSMEYGNKIECEAVLKKGFHELETDFCWIEQEAQLTFYDEAVAQKGLEVAFLITDQLSDEGEVMVTVNGTVTKSVPLVNKGMQVVTFSPEELQGKNRYDVVISSSDSFIPMEEGLGPDMRELAVRIYYIGEMR